jgi:DNA-binding response OmpR family regulator
MAATVFIVEDNSDFGAALADLLSDEGFQTVRFFTGWQALDGLRTQTPSLIITDVVMPGMSGFDLVSALREHETWRHIPVVMLSGGEGTHLPDPGETDAPLFFKPDVASLMRVLPAAARSA